MAILRKGKFGEYYGCQFNESHALTQKQMEVNATYIWAYLIMEGWTIQSIAALLGNMQAESSINPGRWQSDSVYWESGGYGLVQWTPSTKYIDWCSSMGFADCSEMDNNLARMRYEVENKIQWYATSSYDFTFKEFTQSTKSPSYLAKAFLLNYEKPDDQSESVQNYRGSLAESWYTFLTGAEFPDVEEEESKSPTKKKGFNFVLFNRRRMKR